MILEWRSGNGAGPVCSAQPRGQLLTAAWDTFLTAYEEKHRPTLGPLRPNVFTAVRNFLRCGDLASGFLRFHCSNCGHERLLTFTCKGRHRFLYALRDGKHIRPSRLADLLSWKHSGFNIHDGGEKPVPAHDCGAFFISEFQLYPNPPFPPQPPFPRLRSGHPLCQRPSPQKQIPSIFHGHDTHRVTLQASPPRCIEACWEVARYFYTQFTHRGVDRAILAS